MHLMKQFQKGDIGEVFKFVTPNVGLKKMFAIFSKIPQFKDFFRLNFGLKDLF